MNICLIVNKLELLFQLFRSGCAMHITTVADSMHWLSNDDTLICMHSLSVCCMVCCDWCLCLILYHSILSQRCTLVRDTFLSFCHLLLQHLSCVVYVKQFLVSVDFFCFLLSNWNIECIQIWALFKFYLGRGVKGKRSFIFKFAGVHCISVLFTCTLGQGFSNLWGPGTPHNRNTHSAHPSGAVLSMGKPGSWPGRYEERGGIFEILREFLVWRPRLA